MQRLSPFRLATLSSLALVLGLALFLPQPAHAAAPVLSQTEIWLSERGLAPISNNTRAICLH